MSEIRDDAKAWCREGKNPWWRMLLLAWGLWLGWKILTRSESMTPVGALNFGVHELGHLIFSVGGEWIGVAGGSLAQVLAPIYGMWQFRRQRDYFACAFCFGWLSESFLYLSFYIADARAMEMPLVSPFGSEDVIHDWHYLLNSLNLLKKDQVIASQARFLAAFCLLIFLWLGGWLVWQMLFSPKEE